MVDKIIYYIGLTVFILLSVAAITMFHTLITQPKEQYTPNPEVKVIYDEMRKWDEKLWAGFKDCLPPDDSELTEKFFKCIDKLSYIDIEVE